MDFEQFLPIVPLPVIAFVLGLTWAAKSYLQKKSPNQDLPAWFLAVPVGVGLVGGVMYYFYTHDTQALAALTIWRRIIEAVWNGFVSAAGAVFIWEVYKDTIGAWLESRKKPPPATPPPAVPKP